MSTTDAHVRHVQLMKGKPWWDIPNWLPYGLGTDAQYFDDDGLCEWLNVIHGHNFHPSTFRWIAVCKVNDCGEFVLANPIHWDERLQLEYSLPGTCPTHCPDHEYTYDRGDGKHYCVNCGDEPPADWYYAD